MRAASVVSGFPVIMTLHSVLFRISPEMFCPMGTAAKNAGWSDVTFQRLDWFIIHIVVYSTTAVEAHSTKSLLFGIYFIEALSILPWSWSLHCMTHQHYVPYISC